jgi:hypothetical protein
MPHPQFEVQIVTSYYVGPFSIYPRKLILVQQHA